MFNLRNHLNSFRKMAAAALCMHPRLPCRSSSDEEAAPWPLVPPRLPPPASPPPFCVFPWCCRISRMIVTRTSSTRWSRSADTSRNSHRRFEARRLPSAQRKTFIGVFRGLTGKNPIEINLLLLLNATTKFIENKPKTKLPKIVYWLRPWRHSSSLSVGSSLSFSLSLSFSFKFSLVSVSVLISIFVLVSVSILFPFKVWFPFEFWF